MRYFEKCDINEHMNWIEENYPFIYDGKIGELYDTVCYGSDTFMKMHSIREIRRILNSDNNIIMDIVTNRKENNYVKSLVHELLYIHYIDYGQITNNVSTEFGKLSILGEAYYTIDNSSEFINLIELENVLYTYGHNSKAAEGPYIYNEEDGMESDGVVISQTLKLLFEAKRWLTKGDINIFRCLLRNYVSEGLIDMHVFLALYSNIIKGFSPVAKFITLGEIKLFKKSAVCVSESFLVLSEGMGTVDKFRQYYDNNSKHNPRSKISSIFVKYIDVRSAILEMREVLRTSADLDEVIKIANELNRPDVYPVSHVKDVK